jgi:branched-chain amino acid transport system permease protein
MERRCRELLPIFVEQPADLRVAFQRGAPAGPTGVRLDWRGTAAGDEPQGWAVCWFLPEAESGGAAQIDQIQSSRYGRMSRYDVQQAYKMLRVRAYTPQQFTDARTASARALYFLQQTINGLSLGCVYALIAIGYTMVYGITRVINFAYGPLYTIGAFVMTAGWAAMGRSLGTGPAILLSLLAAALTGAAQGWSMARFVFRPLRSAVTTVPLIAAIGLAIALQEWIRLSQGPRTRYVLVTERTTWPLIQGHGFDVYVSMGHVMVGVATLLIGALLWWIQTRTALGRAQRACAQDARTAELLGIDVGWTVGVTFMLGGALAGIAGMVAAAQYGVVTFRMGALVGLKALTAALLGGIGSLPGAAIGGMVVALTEAWTSAYVASEWKDVAVFALLVLILIFRPEGLLGHPADQRPG